MAEKNTLTWKEEMSVKLSEKFGELFDESCEEELEDYIRYLEETAHYCKVKLAAWRMFKRQAIQLETHYERYYNRV